MHRFIDLSEPIIDSMVTYPSDPSVKVETVKSIQQNGSEVHKISLGTHTGAHVDAASHIIKDGMQIHEYPLTHFMGSCILVNYESDLRNLSTNELINGIIFHSGWRESFYNSSDYYTGDRPQIPQNIIDYCIECGCSFFGCDLPSVDMRGDKDKVHHYSLLSNDIVIYENLMNLDLLPVEKPFHFIGLPLFLKNLDASPVRAIAILK